MINFLASLFITSLSFSTNTLNATRKDFPTFNDTIRIIKCESFIFDGNKKQLSKGKNLTQTFRFDSVFIEQESKTIFLFNINESKFSVVDLCSGEIILADFPFSFSKFSGLYFKNDRYFILYKNGELWEIEFDLEIIQFLDTSISSLKAIEILPW